MHIYCELAERDIDAGQRLHKMVVPVFLAVDDGNADEEVAVHLPKPVAEAILKVPDPN